MRDKVVRAILGAPQGWTICGNYRPIRDAIWPSADTLIWLDYPMRIVFLRTLRRTLKRAISREMLWGGCRENLWMQLCTKDSLFLWVINTWRIRKRDYPKMLRSKHCAHMRIIRFRHPTQAQRWLDAMRESMAAADSCRAEKYSA
jgi:adenylate kinase family enzyme